MSVRLTPTRHRAHDDRGVSESTQWAMLAPLIMLILLGLIEAGLWFQARQAVNQAALSVAESCAIAGAPADPEALARRFTDRAGLTAVSVRVSEQAALIRVEVQAGVPLLLGPDLTVRSAATRPKEAP